MSLSEREGIHRKIYTCVWCMWVVGGQECLFFDWFGFLFVSFLLLLFPSSFLSLFFLISPSLSLPLSSPPSFRFQYEEEIKLNANNYDTWFDYVRLEETYGDIDKAREVYERAIAVVPPVAEVNSNDNYNNNNNNNSNNRRSYLVKCSIKNQKYRDIFGLLFANSN